MCCCKRQPITDKETVYIKNEPWWVMCNNTMTALLLGLSANLGWGKKTEFSENI